jgi:hypothetical protein
VRSRGLDHPKPLPIRSYRTDNGKPILYTAQDGHSRVYPSVGFKICRRNHHEANALLRVATNCDREIEVLANGQGTAPSTAQAIADWHYWVAYENQF